jgi:5-methylcytosine-specific restriction protein A
MPAAAKHACGAPLCAALVDDGYSFCPLHAADVAYLGSSSTRGYTKRWQRRAASFKDRYPLCGQRPYGQRPVMSQCFEEGRITAAYAVDHVVPHRQDPVLFWDEERNWQSLCAACHSRKTRAHL